MRSTELATIDPLIPLSLLEAVRDADRPAEPEEAEYVPELLNKRLGTTDTVYAQIRRYADAVRRGVRIPASEVAGLARLLARRPDAITVFADAGVTTGRTLYRRIAAPLRGLLRALPKFAARPLARRRVHRIAARYFGATLVQTGATYRMQFARGRLLLEDTVDGAHGNDDRYDAPYYDAVLQELMKRLGLP